MKKKLILPLLLFIITILTILAGLFIKSFHISTATGLLRVNELIYTFTAFTASLIVTLLLEVAKDKVSKLGHIALLTTLLIINFYLATIFVYTYYKYIDNIIDKLVYLSTLNSLTLLSNFNINNNLALVLKVMSVLLLLVNIITIIIIFISPFIKRIVFHIHTVISDEKEKKHLIIINLSKGFLYKALS